MTDLSYKEKAIPDLISLIETSEDFRFTLEVGLFILAQNLEQYAGFKTLFDARIQYFIELLIKNNPSQIKNIFWQQYEFMIPDIIDRVAIALVKVHVWDSTDLCELVPRWIEIYPTLELKITDILCNAVNIAIMGV